MEGSFKGVLKDPGLMKSLRTLQGVVDPPGTDQLKNSSLSLPVLTED